MGSIRKACRNEAELIFVDAPHHIQLPPEWKTPDTPSEADSDRDLKPRGWWTVQHHEDGTETAMGLDESLHFLAAFIKSQGPFHAVWGFSQGAALAAILTAILEAPHPDTLHPSFKDIKPFQYAIMVAGLKSRDPKNSHFYNVPLRTPHVMLIGKADAIVSAERSNELVQCFAQPRVEFHAGGHHTPSQARWRAFFKDFIASGGGCGSTKVPSPEPGLSQ